MPFDPTLSTDLDLVRFALGDTNEDSELLTDDQIEAVMALYTPLNSAIIVLADGLIARFALKPTSISASGKSISWANRMDAWRALVARLRAGDTLVGAGAAFSVGLTRTDGYSEAAAS